MVKNPRWSKQDNRITRQELRNSLGFYSREPFGDALAELLQARPTMQQLRDWAREQPDKWAAAVKVFGGLYGFHEKLEVQHTGAVAVYNMSDAAVIQRLSELRKAVYGQQALPAPAPSSVQNMNIIEGTVEKTDKKNPLPVSQKGA